MEHAPRVSIILPTYNRAALLPRAIRSIVSQSFSDWELIVIDDASTDDTRKVLDDFAAHDPRICPVHNAHNQYPDISKNLNHGLSLARGTYIARVDDDDYWCDSEKLAKQVAFLDAHPRCVIAGGGTIVVDGDDNEHFRYFKPEEDATIRARALLANPFTHSTVMFRREIAVAVGGYGDFKNAEDWDLWLRMGLRGTFYNFQEYFVRYTMNEASKTFIFKRSQSWEILRLIRAHGKKYPHYVIAFLFNFGQYCYSLLPISIRKVFYYTFSRLKRTI